MPKKAKEVQQPRVLAIDPTPWGFAYAVFDGPQRLIDWGVTGLRLSVVDRALIRYDMLLENYKPHMVVITSMDAKERIGSTAKKVLNCLTRRTVPKVPLKRISVKNIKFLFSQFGAVTKQDIAQTIVEWMPMLKFYVPQRRQLWEPEARNMNIFDAVSLALTYYEDSNEKVISTKKK